MAETGRRFDCSVVERIVGKQSATRLDRRSLMFSVQARSDRYPCGFPAAEMVGAVRGIDPFTGNSYDDTKRYVDALPLTEEDRRKVFETNARRVYRLDRTDYFRRKG
jgi:hypothetical protein